MRGCEVADAIIVGGGHNGLVASAYLARAGLRVLVLEEGPRLGGLAQSSKVFQHARSAQEVSLAAAWSGMLQPTICRSLKLRLDTRILEVQHLYVGSDGDVHFHPLSNRERHSFYLRRRGGSLVLDDIGRLDDCLSNATAALRELTHEPFLRRRIAASRRIDRDTERTLYASMEELFEPFPRLPAVTQAAMVQAGLSLQNGPADTRGGGFFMSYMGLASTAGIPGAWGLPRGGMGAITGSIAARADELGAQIHTGAGVTGVEQDGDSFVVRTHSDEFQTQRVVFACGLHRIRDLIGQEITEPDVRPGSSASIHLELESLPKLRPDLNDLIGTRLGSALIGVGPSSLADVSAAANQMSTQQFSRPLILSTSLVHRDPYPLLYVYAQFVSADADHSQLAAATVDQLRSVFPNIDQLVRGVKVMTPGDIASHFGAPGGHPEHYQMSYPQLLFERPAPELAEYRLAEPGLYHGSAGSFPGGLVSGLPGRNAALVVLADWAKLVTLPQRPRRPERQVPRTSRRPAGNMTVLEMLPRQAGLDHSIQQALALEAAVFLEAFGNTANDLAQEYASYVPRQTRFLAALAPSIVGVMRLILPGPLQQKTLVDLEKAPFWIPSRDSIAAYGVDAARVLDVATVAVAKPWRGSGAFEALALAAVGVARREELTHMTAIIDERLLLYLSRLGVPVIHLAAPEAYLGSDSSVPVLLDLSMRR